MKRYLLFSINLLFITILFPIHTFAIRYVCPGRYQTIMTGDTMARVQQACGKPASTSSQTKTETVPVQLWQWIYTTNNVYSGSNPQLRPKLVITFKKNQVAEIVVKNATTAASFPCYKLGWIKVGSTMDQVRFKCGFPKHANAIQEGVEQQVGVTQWTYNFGAYRPTIIVTFENDKVTNIQQGPMGK